MNVFLKDCMLACKNLKNALLIICNIKSHVSCCDALFESRRVIS